MIPQKLPQIEDAELYELIQQKDIPIFDAVMVIFGKKPYSESSKNVRAVLANRTMRKFIKDLVSRLQDGGMEGVSGFDEVPGFFCDPIEIQLVAPIRVSLEKLLKRAESETKDNPAEKRLPKTPNDGLGRLERVSYQKVIFALSEQHRLRFEPDAARSSLPTNLSIFLQSKGISLDQKSVRKILQDTYKTIKERTKSSES